MKGKAYEAVPSERGGYKVIKRGGRLVLDRIRDRSRAEQIAETLCRNVQSRAAGVAYA
jgi:hypothetical protein